MRKILQTIKSTHHSLERSNGFFVAHLLLLCIFLLSSCGKDQDIFIPDQTYSVIPLNDTEALEAFLVDIQPETSSFQVMPQNSGRLSVDKVIVDLPDNMFSDANGNIFEGAVNLALNGLSGMSQLLSQNVTMNTNNSFVSNFGGLKIDLADISQNIQITNGKSIQVLIPFEGEPNPNVTVYELEENNPFEKSWIPTNIDVSLTEYLDESTETWEPAYYFEVDRFGAFICGVDASPEEGLANVCISLPQGYDNNNTLAYLVIDNQLTVVDLAWQDAYFCNELLPANTQAEILILAISGDGTYRAATQPIHTDIGFQLKKIEPSVYELNEILELIDSF